MNELEKHSLVHISGLSVVSHNGKKMKSFAMRDDFILRCFSPLFRELHTQTCVSNLYDFSVIYQPSESLSVDSLSVKEKRPCSLCSISSLQSFLVKNPTISWELEHQKISSRLLPGESICLIVFSRHDLVGMVRSSLQQDI